VAPQGASRQERNSWGRVVVLQPCGVSSGSTQAKELTRWQATRLVCTPRPQLWLHCTIMHQSQGILEEGEVW